MKNLRNAVFNLMANLRSNLPSNLRTMAIALACALVIFSSATPAMAFGKERNSRLDKGVEQLDTVQKKSEEAITGPIDNANDAESVMADSAKGLNGVQGDANKENMITREGAKGNTIEGNIKKVLEEVTP